MSDGLSTTARLGGFVAVLAVVFGAAFGVGQLAGIEPAPAATAHDGSHSGSSQPGDAAHLPAGLQVTDQGYTLATEPYSGTELAFRVTGPDGHPVTALDTVHDRPMHLIVVRRDLSGFQHVHPQLDADGTWRVPLRLAGAGTWRAFADFTPTGGPALTLGADVDVPGDYRPVPLPAPAATSTVDGYTVTLSGALEPGRASELTLRVERAGTPVTDLQPYLGAAGHLVALRQADLAYLHVHPSGPVTGGPEIRFTVEVPSTGTYGLFLDFRHGDTVRTASFTVRAEGGDHAHD